MPIGTQKTTSRRIQMILFKKIEIIIRKYIPLIWTHWSIVRKDGIVQVFKNGALDSSKEDMTMEFWAGEVKR